MAEVERILLLLFPGLVTMNMIYCMTRNKMLKKGADN